MGLFDFLFSKSKANKQSAFVLGKKFPLEGYNTLGDHTSILLNESSFDVVISLSNLSKQEKNAIGNSEFEVFVVATNLVPFIILRFGNVMKTDVTINIQKMNSGYREEWFASTNKSVRLFLLEGNNATLQCIRTFHFDDMEVIKGACRNQINLNKEDIDTHIKMVYQQITTEEMMRLAQVRFVVPKAICL